MSTPDRRIGAADGLVRRACGRTQIIHSGRPLPGCAVGHWTSVTRWGAAGAAFVTASIRWLAAARLSHLDRDTTAMRRHESTHWAGQRALASSPRTPGECDAWRLWPVRVRAESGLAQYFWTTLILYGHSVRISR